MSTLTKEWLLKTIAELEEERDAVPGVVNEDAAMALAAMKLAQASLEAEPVCVIDQSNLDYLKSGSDADVWPASRTEMGDVLLYRSATPAPVSVPDAMEMDDDFDSAFEHGKAVGWNAYRAAMLQGADGNSPVIPDGWVACSERMPEGMTDVHISNGHDIGQGWWDGDTWQTQHDYYSVPGDVTHWMPLPNPPKE
ncbi:DUF551 domain-containing protein [Enterobacter cloacae]|nr:DUF551 domain-containing protein [Enterobacter cloacae]